LAADRGFSPARTIFVSICPKPIPVNTEQVTTSRVTNIVLDRCAFIESSRSDFLGWGTLFIIKWRNVADGSRRQGISSSYRTDLA
jgi:hypothetical protein